MWDIVLGRVYLVWRAITGGSGPSATSVPRAMLITKMQVMMEQKELEIASGCREGEAVTRELTHLTLDRAGRSRGVDKEPDDLALALAPACWRAKVR
jgi:hypothetical protein